MMSSRQVQPKHTIKQTPHKVLQTDNDEEFFETEMLESEVNAIKNNNLNNTRFLQSLLIEDNSMMFPIDESQIKSFMKHPLELEAQMSSEYPKPIVRNRTNIGYFTPVNKKLSNVKNLD